MPRRSCASSMHVPMNSLGAMIVAPDVGFFDLLDMIAAAAYRPGYPPSALRPAVVVTR